MGPRVGVRALGLELGAWSQIQIVRSAPPSHIPIPATSVYQASREPWVWCDSKWLLIICPGWVSLGQSFPLSTKGKQFIKSPVVKEHPKL